MNWYMVSSSDPRSLHFPCGSSRTLCLREDILDIETTARKFELDDNVLHDVAHYQEGDDLALLLNMFPQAEEEGYVPYCEINFEWTVKAEDRVEQTFDEQASNAPASSIELVPNTGSTMERNDCLPTSINVSYLHPDYYIGRTVLTSIMQKWKCILLLAQVQENAYNSQEGNNISVKPLRDISRCRSERLACSPSADYLKVHEKIAHVSDVRTVIDQDDDESDSEIFRVKRRFRAENGSRRDSTSVNIEHQVCGYWGLSLGAIFCSFWVFKLKFLVKQFYDKGKRCWFLFGFSMCIFCIHSCSPFRVLHKLAL